MTDHANQPSIRENQLQGDPMTTPKNNSHTRIHFQNVGGVNLTTHGTWTTVCHQWLHMQVDIALACEHQLDTTKPKVNKLLRAQAALYFGSHGFRLEPISTPVPSHTDRKAGGVLSTLLGNISGRHLEAGNDTLGRWTFTKLRTSSADHPITVITTYQVCAVNPRTAGPTTYSQQLYAQYQLEGRDTPENLRKHHSNDLGHFVKECQAKGERIIVAGDFNETLGDTTHGMTRLCSECHLVDPFITKHHLTGFATHNRGSDVIDYILVDAFILPSIVKCGYEAFSEHIQSDHRGVYIDFHTSSLFGDTVPPIDNHTLRDMSTKRINQIPSYFQHKDKHLQDHNWYQKIQILQDHIQSYTPNDALAEQLYCRLIEACSYAGNNLSKYPSAPFSPEIAVLRHTLDYLRLAKSWQD